MRIIINKVIGVDADGKKLHYIEASGSSGEEKPTGTDVGGKIVDSSLCTESDTGKVFFFNEGQEDWVVQFSFQS